MFNETLQASAALDCKQRAWWINMADRLEWHREDSRKWRKTQESQQQQKKEMHLDIVGLLRLKQRYCRP